MGEESPPNSLGVVWVLCGVGGDLSQWPWWAMATRSPCCFPTVSWQKDGSALCSHGHLLIRAEGERHTLLLREARTADAGNYTATATNELGQASCAATLAVRPGRQAVGPRAGWGEW